MSPKMVVGVQATFSVGDSEMAHQFDSSERTRASPPSEGTGKEDNPTGDDKYDYRYTGRHDHGPLPVLKSGGPHEVLVNALLEAKQDSDRFLTSVIDRGEASPSIDDGRRVPASGASRDAAQVAAPGKTGRVDMEVVDSTAGRRGAGETRGEEREEEVTVTSPEAPVAQPAKRPKP